MKKFEVGDVVDYNASLFYVYETMNERAIIVPLDDVDFMSDNSEIKLSNARDVPQSRLKEYLVG